MPDTPDLGPALQFLSRLKKNNNKPWFDAHKDQYQEAMAQFEQLVGRLIEGLPEIEILRRKQVCVTEPFSDAVVGSPRFPALALESMKALKPFVDYLNRVAMGSRA